MSAALRIDHEAGPRWLVIARVFLPLEKANPFRLAVLALMQDYTYQFPRLQPQTGGRRLKCLLGWGHFNVVFPLRHRHGLHVQHEGLRLRVVARLCRQVHVEGTGACGWEGCKDDRVVACMSNRNLGDDPGRQPGEAECKNGPLVYDSSYRQRRHAALRDGDNGRTNGDNEM